MAKLYIYRNLRTGGFSVRHLGKVIDRVQTAVLSNVTFRVNEAGRQRALREKQKNVHSFIVTSSISTDIHLFQWGLASLQEIRYNPYKGDCFTLNDAKIEEAQAVLLFGGKCFLITK